MMIFSPIRVPIPCGPGNVKFQRPKAACATSGEYDTFMNIQEVANAVTGTVPVI